MKKNIYQCKTTFCLKTITMALLLTPQMRAKVVVIESEKEYHDAVSNCKDPMVVQFAAEWCGACQAVKQQVESISDEAEFENIVFVRANLDNVSNVAEQNNVTGVPNFLYMRDGNVQKQAVGFKNLLTFKDEMRENIRQNCMQNQTKAKSLVASNNEEIGEGTLQQQLTKKMEAQADELAEQFPLPELEKINVDTQEVAITVHPEATAKPAETSLLSSIKEVFMGLINKIKEIIQRIVDAIAGLFRK